MPKLLKFVLCCLGILLVAALGFFIWIFATEYKPAAEETVLIETQNGSTAPVKILNPGDTLTVFSQNTGYAGLGEEADFFMDGGSSVQPKVEHSVKNLTGLSEFLNRLNADVYFLQEVDTDSKRSYGINQAQTYWNSLSENNPDRSYSSAFALNFSCNYVPYPMPPIGKVHSGLQTISGFSMNNAKRVSLPCPFQWPVSACNLKRCLLVSYVPLENTDRQLVLVNLHLEAYDDGEGKAAQTKALMDLLTREYEKGNYVIAGGDFNQIFPGTLETYPINSPDLWTPGVLEEDMLPEGWQFAYDSVTPTCRLLNQPYNPDSEDTQFYILDGFILSPNCTVRSVTTVNSDFLFADHNGVKLEVALEK